MSNAFILSQGLNFINPRVPSRRAPSFLKSNTAAFLTAVKIGQLLRLGTNILTGSTRKKWSWWYKLRCYTRILSPGKSRKNTLEKVSFFFWECLYCQSVADTSLTFRATRSGWWMNGEAFTILNPRLFCRIFLLKHRKMRIAYKQWCSNFPRRVRKPK